MQEISRRREKPSLVGINVLGVGQEPFDFNYGLEKGSEGEQKTVAWSFAGRAFNVDDALC